MVRKTALVTAMLAAFANQAYAMGLGEIRLNSVLNQPLNAEIELLSATPGDLAELRVALASPEAYGRAGVERAFFHTKLRFSVVSRPDGSAVIKVTSRDAVREPYLDFLVEATWGSGQVLREYTVLVDPPALMPAPAPVTRAPVAAAAPQPVPAAAPPSRAAIPPAGYSGGEYRTSRSDTLWRIAAEVRPGDAVSMEQTMLGLLEANPEAFYDQNINNLKAGYVLRVPSAEEMAAVSQADALAEVRRQNRLWRDGRAAAASPGAPAAASDSAAADAAAAPSSDAAEPQLKLVAPEVAPGSGGVDDAAGIEALRGELALATEAVEAERLQNQELNARVQQLEEQIATLNRLIELKNSELAQLGGTVTPSPEAPGAAPDVTADTAADAAPAAEAGTETAVAEAVPGTGSETSVEAAPVVDGAAPEQTPVESVAEPMAEAQADAQAQVEAPAPVVTPAPVPEPAPAVAEPPAAQDEGLIASLLANPMVKWGAAGAAVLVALFAWLAARRRRMQDSRFQESILAERLPVTPAAGTAAPAAAAAVAAASASAESEAGEPAKSSHSDSSLFTDFAVSDMGAIQNEDEADPIAEADVYLAYGRYQQAEELVRNAVARAPERTDLRLKLFEVLSSAQNSSAFDAEAEALLAELGSQDDETWKRVAEMGRELSPSNPLYQPGGLSASGASGAAAVAAAVAAEPAGEEMTEDNGLDFDMGDQVADAGLETPDASMVGGDDNSLDFDLGEFESFTRPAEAAAPELPAADDLDFDLSAAADDDEAADEGTLAASDEVATKLDLARAYMEMGDPDGARSILQEVMEEGSDTQRSEAESLLQKVS